MGTVSYTFVLDEPSHDLCSNLLDAFLEHPVFDEEGRVPIQFSTIYEYQQNDQTVTQLPIEKPDGYQYKTLGGFPIICTA